MTNTVEMQMPSSRPGFFARTEAWLDERGKGAWIALMVLSFIFVWPIGIAVMAYMIWSKRMFSKSCRHKSHRHEAGFGDRHFARRHGFDTSGNTAFDAYKAETLRRLMSEQEAFETFLERLRAAKDKSQFDQFMDERATAARKETDEAAEDEGEWLDEPTKASK